MINKENYSHLSHEHCWNNKDKPCGIPIEKHEQCCLCDLSVPQDGVMYVHEKVEIVPSPRQDYCNIEIPLKKFDKSIWELHINREERKELFYELDTQLEKLVNDVVKACLDQVTGVITEEERTTVLSNLDRIGKDILRGILGKQREEERERIIEVIKDWYTIAPKYRTKENLINKINKQ